MVLGKWYMATRYNLHKQIISIIENFGLFIDINNNITCIPLDKNILCSSSDLIYITEDYSIKYGFKIFDSKLVAKAKFFPEEDCGKPFSVQCEMYIDYQTDESMSVISHLSTATKRQEYYHLILSNTCKLSSPTTIKMYVSSLPKSKLKPIK